MGIKRVIIFVCMLTCTVGNIVHGQSLSSDLVKFRRISKEIILRPGQKVYFFNHGRPFHIRKWAQSSIKLEASIATKEVMSYDTDRLLEMLNIYFDTTGSSLDIISFAKGSIPTDPHEGTANGGAIDLKVRDVLLYQKINKLIVKERPKISHISYDPAFVLYVPNGVEVTLENHYSKISLDTDADNFKVFLDASDLTAKNIDTLTIASSLSNIKIKNIGIAGIESNNDMISVGNFQRIKLNTSSSTINLLSGVRLDMKSRMDKIHVDSVTEVTGNTYFGDFTAGWIGSSLEITGRKTHIKVLAISRNVKSIGIDNSWANLNLPLQTIPAFDLTFTGFAKVQADFKFNFQGKGNLDKQLFNVVIGRPPFAKLNIECPKCIVDFR